MNTVTVVSVYPDLLGTYGDVGNVIALRYQAVAHDIDLEVIAVRPGEPVPDSADLYVLGGGEDSAQTAAVRALRTSGALNRAAEAGAAVFAVCAGYQMLGEYFPDANGQPVAGLGVLDIRTDRLPSRAVGELLAQPLDPEIPVLTGYENHGGATHLGPEVTPLARVTHGVGNGNGTEGARNGHILGTYLHGPGLARNPRLADLLLGWCVGEHLPARDDDTINALRTERIAAARGT
jgi:lipid II isoglutaminyl synthase (glutamine-hydrolysing)